MLNYVRSHQPADREALECQGAAGRCQCRRCADRRREPHRERVPRNRGRLSLRCCRGGGCNRHLSQGAAAAVPCFENGIADAVGPHGRTPFEQRRSQLHDLYHRVMYRSGQHPGSLSSMLADVRAPHAREIWRVYALPRAMPHVPLNEEPGSSRIRASMVRNAFGGQVIGSTARLRRLTLGSGSPLKSIKYG